MSCAYRCRCLDPFPGYAQDLLDQLIVAVARDPCRLRKARVHRWIGNDAGERIQLDDVWYAEPVDAHIDATPVAAPERAIRVECDALGLAAERVGCADWGALEDRERVFARIPDPLRFVAVDGRGAGGQRRKIECDEGQTAHVAVVAEDRDRELRSGEIRLDEDRLIVALQEERRSEERRVGKEGRSRWSADH